jgi:phenylpyruvate tautomerase PptA (4-oxalocrotonate tautomerase family)
MTIMRVSLVGTELSRSQKESLANRLIEAFALVEVGRDTPEIRNGFLVRFEEIASEDLWMGQRPMAEATPSGKAALIETHVMAGPWNEEMKADLFARLEEIVRDVAGMPRSSGGADFWMTFVEVPEGGWGLGGRPVSIGRLAPVFLPDRQERIGTHLAGRAVEGQ